MSRRRRSHSTGSRRRPFRAGCRLERLEDRRMMAGDLAGLEGREMGEVVPVAEVRLEVTDAAGKSVSAARKGEELQLSAYVRDRRFVGQGVFSAYLDVEYDADLLKITGPVHHGEDYLNSTSGDSSSPGLIDELGGFAGLDPVGSSDVLLFRVPFVAKDLGDIKFVTNAAEGYGHEFLVYGDNRPVSTLAVDFGGAAIEVVEGVDAVDDVISVKEDSIGVKLEVLKNDMKYGQQVSITAVSQPDRGGEVALGPHAQSLIYTPQPDFYGQETFTYTVKDAAGQVDTATVRLLVKNVNDPPQAVDDSFTVQEDSRQNLLNVLANDSHLPDPKEFLKIVKVGSPSHGGKVDFDSEGNIEYTPAPDFHGVEKLAYIVSDGVATQEAMVSINVLNVNDPPVAIADQAKVYNYSDDKAEVIDALANDATQDPDEQLVIIDAVTTGGGRVEIEADGGRLLYTPEPFVYDKEEILYTISDGNEGIAKSRVSIENVNPWHHYADPLDINKDGGVTPLDALIDVNYLNHIGAGVPTRPEVIEEYGGPPFMDPSFDGRVTALDPLMVINYLNSRSVAPPPPDGVAGPLQFRVNDRLKPIRELPGFVKGESRPVSRMTDSSGVPVDFASNELFVMTENADELQAFIDRWEGELLQTIKPTAYDMKEGSFPTTHLVRINTELAAVSQLPYDLWEMDPANHGEHHVSDAEGLQLLAAAAREGRDGTLVGINWIGRSHSYRSLETTEAANGATLSDGTMYSRNTFDWPHLNGGSTQDIGVTDAWRALELAGRLENKVEVAVIDGGFQPNADFPDGWTAVSNVPFEGPIGNENWMDCGDSECNWHGTNVVMAGMGLPDNDGFGGAGPGGPVARPIMVQTWGDWFTSMTAVLLAKFEGAKIINMSYGARVPASVSFTVLPFDHITAAVRASGSLIFASAGNGNENLDEHETFLGVSLWEKAWHTPAENTGVIAVGGLADNSQRRHGRSSYGEDEVDLFAPWSNLVGPDPDNPANFARRIGGTSFAAPYAAGVAALIWAAKPRLSADEVEDILYDTAHSSPDPTVDHYVNAADAVYRALGDVHPFVSITTPRSGASFSAGGNSVALSADVEDLEDGRLPVNSISWSSNRDGHLGNGSLVETTRLSQGEHVISVTARDSAGHETTESVRITIENDAPTMRIDSPTTNSRFVEGQQIRFRSTSIDINNAPDFRLPDDQIVWESDRDGVLGRGHDIRTALSRGTHTITVIGNDGQTSGSASIRLVIEEATSTPPRASFQSPQQDLSVYFDGFDSNRGMYYKDIELIGWAEDAEDGQMPGSSLEWRTNQPGLASGTGVWSGEYVHVRLFSDNSFGVTHEITLVATDSDGLESSPILRRIQIKGLA